MKTKSTIPPAADFDFRGVDPALVYEAAVWEYSRTLPAVRAAGVRFLDSEIQGKTVRQHLQAEARKPYPGPRSLFHRILDRDEQLARRMVDFSMFYLGKYEHLRMLLWDRADFPAPWTNAQRSPTPAAEDSTVDVEPMLPAIARFEGLMPQGKPLLLTRYHKPFLDARFCLRVNWRGATRAGIAADFYRWLDKEAGKHPEMKSSGKAGQVQTEPLKWLGAYRLKAAGLSYSQACAILDLYRYPGNRACQNEAVKLGIDPVEVPLPLKAQVQSEDAFPDFTGDASFSKAVGKARKELSRLEREGSLKKFPVNRSG